MKDGSYYEGHFNENKAEDQGKFFSGRFNYEGHFLDNKFHGIGTERDDLHQFHGTFKQHKKVKGTFTWKDGNEEYEYIGEFN